MKTLTTSFIAMLIMLDFIIPWNNSLIFNILVFQGINYQLVLAASAQYLYAFFVYPFDKPQDGHSIGNVYLGYTINGKKASYSNAAVNTGVSGLPGANTGMYFNQ